MNEKLNPELDTYSNTLDLHTRMCIRTHTHVYTTWVSYTLGTQTKITHTPTQKMANEEVVKVPLYFEKILTVYKAKNVGERWSCQLTPN